MTAPPISQMKVLFASVPALALHIFRWCLIAGACFILYYTWQSTRNIVVLKENTSEQNNKSTSVAGGSRRQDN